MAPKDESSHGVNLSRRHFLKSTGVAGLAATVVGEAQPAAQSGLAALGSRSDRTRAASTGCCQH